MNKITTLVQSSSNHSCSLTPGLLIAMQLQVQLGNLADKCDKMNRNQLFKDIWLWMVGEEQWEVLTAFSKRAKLYFVMVMDRWKDRCHSYVLISCASC